MDIQIQFDVKYNYFKYSQLDMYYYICIGYIKVKNIFDNFFLYKLN